MEPPCLRCRTGRRARSAAGRPARHRRPSQRGALLMVYMDTSAIVALIVNEPGSLGVAAWYASARGELVSAAWCVTEFGSALGLKQRTNQLGAVQAQQAWDRFQRLVANDLRLLPVEPTDF